jgi:hypothetical protein
LQRAHAPARERSTVRLHCSHWVNSTLGRNGLSGLVTAGQRRRSSFRCVQATMVAQLPPRLWYSAGVLVAE